MRSPKNELAIHASTKMDCFYFCCANVEKIMRNNVKLLPQNTAWHMLFRCNFMMQFVVSWR